MQDPAIRKILKDTDGLGTEATRAGIIELLFKRQFLQRQAKKIHATDAGKGLIQGLPAVSTTPDMTAHWETQLNAISQREASYQGFMQPLEKSLHELISESQSVLPVGLKNIKAPAKKTYKRRKTKASPTKKSVAKKTAVK